MASVHLKFDTMNISITYKRQQKEIRPCGFECDSGDPDVRELSLSDVVEQFDIPRKHLEAVAQEYPEASLHEINEDVDDAGSLDIVYVEQNGIFSCKTSKSYRLYLGQRVELKDGSVSGKKKKETSIFNEADIEMAAILSHAVYERDPIQFINDKYRSCPTIATLTGLKFASKATFPYLIGITKTEAAKETMWVAFRGSENWDDFLTDSYIIPALSNNGMVHKGFWERSSKFPHTRFAYECYQSSNTRRRLIFTGHSLGGSVAHLSALFHLDGKSRADNPDIFSIAFGAPFFGNTTVAENLIQRNLNQHLLTVVNCQDCVPGILNIIESVSALGKTAETIYTLCEETFETIFPTVGQGLMTAAKDYLNKTIPKLKDFLETMHLEYKPIGTYGFIQMDISGQGTRECEWTVNYCNNQLENVCDKQKFNDYISKELNELYSARSQKYTDESVVNHCMINYIERLKSCRVIRSTNEKPREITEIDGFHVTVKSAMAVCCRDDLKVTIQGTNLDFISVDKQNCLKSQLELFEERSHNIFLEHAPHKVVITYDKLVPEKNRIIVGQKQFTLHTHFGEISFYFQWDEHKLEYPEQLGMFSTLNKNFLMATFLRSLFEYVHSERHLDIKDILEGAPTALRSFLKLIKNILSEKYHPFEQGLQEHFKKFTCQKSKNEPFILTNELHADVKPLLEALCTALSKLPNYELEKSRIKTVIYCTSLAAIVLASIYFIQKLNISSYSFDNAYFMELYNDLLIRFNSVSRTDSYSNTSPKAISDVLCGYSKMILPMFVRTLLAACHSGLTLLRSSPSTIKRLLYQGHLYFLLDNIGGNSRNCANEQMAESKICNILLAKSIEFNNINMKDTATIKKIIIDKNIFVPNTNQDGPNLVQATDNSKYQAFKLLHDVYYIHELRKWMTEHIYISFVGAHRAGKSSLLKALWNLPAQIGDMLTHRTRQVRLYTLEDSENNKKVHIIDFPGITDPEKEIRQYTDQYAVCSSFYVIVAQACTDYDSATKLINEITNTNSTTDVQSDDNHVRSRNTSVPFVVIVTHTESIPGPIEPELTELANDRLKIDRDLICPCFNKEAVGNEDYVNRFRDVNLAGIKEVREFLTKQFTKVFGKDYNFDQYMNYRYRQN